jgi:hypothetical protein
MSSPDMNITDCGPMNIAFEVGQTAMSPLSANFKIYFDDYFDENKTLVYQAAVEFPPLTFTKGTIIALVLGCVVGKRY